MSKKIHNKLNKVYGDWTVIRFAGRYNNSTFWICRCNSCNREKEINSSVLVKPIICTQCNHKSVTHGYASKYNRTYKIWCGMKYRCSTKHKTINRYNINNIIVCDRWEKFENFLEDMGECPDNISQIDRIDNNKNYCKENCRWATPKQQANNRRSNRLIEFENIVKTVAEWADLLKVDANVFNNRISNGWDFIKAATTSYLRSSKYRVRRFI